MSRHIPRWLIVSLGVVMAVYLLSVRGEYDAGSRSLTIRFDSPLPAFGTVRVEILAGVLGFLVLKAALDYDPDEATGIDGTLRTIAANSLKSVFSVWLAASDCSPLRRDFAEIWQAADKIVYSRTLETISTRKTQLERTFDPEAIRQLKASGEHDILIGGPELAAHAFRAGLIDECHLFLIPILVGGGKSALPDNVRLELELLAERRFGNGTVYLRYRTRQGRAT